MRICEGCGCELRPAQRSHARFCSRRCKGLTGYARNRAHRQLTGINFYWGNPERQRALRRKRYRIQVYGKDIGDNPLVYKKDRFRAARALGYRSGLEVAVTNQLKDAGVDFQYEPFRIPYEPLKKVRYYVPDILLPNGIIVEPKGRFVTADRQKHLAIQSQYPGLDLRFVFSNPNNKIGKGSNTSYGDWCDHKGFLYSRVSIPLSWLREEPNAKSLAIIKTLMESK